MGHALFIEDGQNLVPLVALVFETRTGRRLLKLIALDLMPGISMLDIVGRAPRRIAEGLVRLRDHAECFGISRFLIVRVKALSLNAINTVDGFLIGVRADLKRLVIVDEHSSTV